VSDTRREPPSSPESGGYESLCQTLDDQNYSLDVLVDGVNCAGCIQKIESRLGRMPNVTYARLNFSTRRLSMTWHGPAAYSNQLVGVIEDLGYKVHPFDPERLKESTQEEENFLLVCLGVAGFVSGNVMMLSIGLWATTLETMGSSTRDLMHWISALMVIPAIIYAGRPFFRSALKVLRAGHTNMDVPISVGLILTTAMSLFQTITHQEHAYFDSAVMLMFFLLIGRYLDLRVRRSARSSATDLLSSFSGFANVIEGSSLKRVPIRDVKEDMIIRVTAGEKFPVDGTLVSGTSQIDTSLVTGESLPRDANIGDLVYAGTLNLGNTVDVRVAKAASDSLLADIVRLMEKAGQAQANYVRLADRVARLYTPVVHLFALLSFIGWWGFGGSDWQSALMIAVAVLIITCPCAIALAVPVAQVLAIGRLMKNKVYVKAGDALERLASVDTVIVDKTGTLTLGQPTVLRMSDDDAYLQIAASLAAHSRHPLSKALVAAWGDAPLLPLDAVKEESGHGLEALYKGKAVKLGKRDWCGAPPPSTESPASHTEVILRMRDDFYTFHFADQLRDDTHEVIRLLMKEGLSVILVSGDRGAIVDDIAGKLGIQKRYAEVKPPEKFKILSNLKEKGHKVLMIGDGLNDAPALAGATISMAPGSAIDMAQNAADIIFMGDKFHPVYDTYKTAVLCQKLVKQNFVLSILYNVIAIPAAVAGFVTPLVAALAMSGSSLVVIANSFRLRFERF